MRGGLNRGFAVYYFNDQNNKNNNKLTKSEDCSYCPTCR